jgi:DNA repair protein RadA/Sms
LSGGAQGLTFQGLNSLEPSPARLTTGLAELDRVLGGGLVPGGAVLIGGDPGIGKSTLLLQAAAGLARLGNSVAYITGEEAEAQIRERARRLEASDAPVALAAETGLRPILEALKRTKPDVIIIDSIQTLWSDALDAAPGSVAQVRACSQELARLVKKTGACLILVGHVTKDGQIAGPRVVEHLVDGVFYFEGDRAHQFRILRGVKNRYGATDEIGVFEMTPQGLVSAADPSRMFLTTEGSRAPGAAVAVALEGSRPMMIEVEALAGPQAPGSPRRAVVGWDSARLAMLLAVMETRCGYAYAGRDVYFNVAGGYKLSDPSADLAAAAALLSSTLDVPCASDTIWIGEVALSGAVRGASRIDLRLREAARLGFKRAVVPADTLVQFPGLTLVQIARLSELADHLGQGSTKGRRGRGATHSDLV